MTPHLEKVRDELAEKVDETVDPECEFVGFKNGFNAAVKEMWPTIKALQFYSKDRSDAHGEDCGYPFDHEGGWF